MGTSNLTIILIMVIVLIVLPVLLAKLSGRNPMEMFFGKRVNDSPFARKKGQDGKDGKAENGDDRRRNSTKQELMECISSLISYARRNHFYAIVPGTLTDGDKVATLSVVIVTRRAVLGFNCFGYGGTIECSEDGESWKQTLMGAEKRFDSPVLKNRAQKALLEKILKDCGFEGIPVNIYGVFTAKGVELKNRYRTGCHTAKTLLPILSGTEYAEDRGVDPKKVGKELEKHVKRA